ncbi:MULTISPECIES: S1/P1 nuclease [unclassified Bradyrhizobium]|uniref:S1/P1 nuclease n=1 Tax=unclassified Bradyrhizobium TaxID=2631580 RepID=UPI002916B8A2|nr:MULTISPECIES: S1/P1 nuclease [unclassified Bradyrhizobium]
MRSTVSSSLIFLVTSCSAALGWGQEGHSIVAEVAQRRLTPAASAAVARLLGDNHSLASIGSWADDERDSRPETYNWHFVDIPIASNDYDAQSQCAQSAAGDCVIAELNRLKNDLRCAQTDADKRDALKFAVHFVGDIHQPLHTVLEQKGGNGISVELKMRGSLICREGPCPIVTSHANFHAAWDTNLINKTTWNWGAYVDRLENGWLNTDEAKNGADGGTFIEWATQTHHSAQQVWNRKPANNVLDDNYYQEVLPVLDQQLGLAGIRLARFLNEAYSSTVCPRP